MAPASVQPRSETGAAAATGKEPQRGKLRSGSPVGGRSPAPSGEPRAAIFLRLGHHPGAPLRPSPEAPHSVEPPGHELTRRLLIGSGARVNSPRSPMPVWGDVTFPGGDWLARSLPGTRRELEWQQRRGSWGARLPVGFTRCSGFSPGLRAVREAPWGWCPGSCQKPSFLIKNVQLSTSRGEGAGPDSSS
uniref:Uncharacterized protein n=1 Tax=Sphaerodactylus townsendi TaxID=933632 RepID=A0ACB8EDY2_9SAUR